MEITSRLPTNSGASNDLDSTARGLGTGAIESLMAVSFREEKLALQAGSVTDANEAGGVPSPAERHDRA